MSEGDTTNVGTEAPTKPVFTESHKAKPKRRRGRLGRYWRRVWDWSGMGQLAYLTGLMTGIPALYLVSNSKLGTYWWVIVVAAALALLVPPTFYTPSASRAAFESHHTATLSMTLFGASSPAVPIPSARFLARGAAGLLLGLLGGGLALALATQVGWVAGAIVLGIYLSALFAWRKRRKAGGTRP
jgi:hypothetical protein